MVRLIEPKRREKRRVTLKQARLKVDRSSGLEAESETGLEAVVAPPTSEVISSVSFQRALAAIEMAWQDGLLQTSESDFLAVFVWFLQHLNRLLPMHGRDHKSIFERTK